ncbi:MAG: ABC transporter ATP-binding protein [Candidatus Micrarchaeia archaeon]
MYAVEAVNVSKNFSNIKAVERVSFALRNGEHLILLGPNGAGKSTLLRLVSGLIKPTAGSVKIFGNEASNVEETSSVLSFVSENYALYDNLTVRENLLFFGTLYGLKKREVLEASDEMLERLDAREYLDRKVGELSRGTKQKIAICRALISKPRILLLDEPTAFLDPYAAEEVRGLIKESKASILYATQRLDELNRFEGKIMLMNKGRSIGYGTLEEILSMIKDVEIEVTLLNSRKIRLSYGKARQEGKRIVATLKSAREIPKLVKDIVANGGEVVSVSYLKESLGSKMRGT